MDNIGGIMKHIYHFPDCENDKNHIYILDNTPCIATFRYEDTEKEEFSYCVEFIPLQKAKIKEE